MLLLKVLASFVALTFVLAAPVPIAPLRERSISLLEDAYLPTKRAEGCECAHGHSLKSVDAPRARRNRGAHKKIKHHKLDFDETLSPAEEREIEKRTWGWVKTGLRAVGLMKPSRKSEFIQRTPSIASSSTQGQDQLATSSQQAHRLPPMGPRDSVAVNPPISDRSSLSTVGSIYSSQSVAKSGRPPSPHPTSPAGPSKRI